MIPEQFVAPAAAPYAATASPLTETEDVASAPAVTCAALAPVFEYVAPATPVTVKADVAPPPVIDYIAPSPAVSYPSFLSFVQSAQCSHHRFGEPAFFYHC